jgi:hypothetical protein
VQWANILFSMDFYIIKYILSNLKFFGSKIQHQVVPLNNVQVVRILFHSLIIIIVCLLCRAECWLPSSGGLRLASDNLPVQCSICVKWSCLPIVHEMTTILGGTILGISVMLWQIVIEIQNQWCTIFSYELSSWLEIMSANSWCWYGP